MRRRSGRSAFTLVEAVVALAVAGVVLAGLWSFVSSNERARARGAAKLDGVRAGLQFEEVLASDLGLLYVDPTHVVSLTAGPEPCLSFFVGAVEGSAPERGVVSVQRLSYRFTSRDCALWRQVGAGSPERLPGAYEGVVFELRVQATAPACLTYLVTSIPDELAAKDPSRRRPSDRSVLCGTFPLRALDARAKHPFWRCLVEAPATSS
jgi:hypothetical protein